MGRHIMGALFMESALPLKLRDDIDWPRFLHQADVPFLTAPVRPKAWVPIETFERIALALLSLEGAKPQRFRALGARAVDRLVEANPTLLVPADPRETLMRFIVVRQSFFDFPVIQVHELTDTRARLGIAYGLCAQAEQAAKLSTAGFLTRPLELCGATRIKARLAGQLELDWKPWPLH